VFIEAKTAEVFNHQIVTQVTHQEGIFTFSHTSKTGKNNQHK